MIRRMVSFWMIATGTWYGIDYALLTPRKEYRRKGV